MEKAVYKTDDIPLIFSVDYNGGKRIADYVEKYVWPYGPKLIILHERRLGLRKNILFCGDLTRKYGAVLLLEDDLVVSPDFYQFAVRATEFYKADNMIAGISLYSYEYSEIERERFYPYQDGQDVYFMQWPSSWGQIWTDKQWYSFREWYEENKETDLYGFRIPPSVRRWPSSSWKKFFVAYLAHSGRFFVYPRWSLTSHLTGSGGTHAHETTTPLDQVSLFLGSTENWLFTCLQESIARYDSFFQPKTHLLNALCPWLRNYDYQIDLQATKPFSILEKPYLISVRECKKPLKSFAWNLFPFELNIAYNIPGMEIHFGETKYFEDQLPLRKYGPLVTWGKRLISPVNFREIVKIVIGKWLRRNYRKISNK